MSGPAAPVRVRPLLRQDVDGVIALLRDQEFVEGNTEDALRRCFDYPWSAERPHSGFVLTEGDRIVGCAGIVFSSRRSGGVERKIASTTTWYVDPAWRRYGLQLITATMGLRDHVLVTLSASPLVAEVLEKMGFEVVGRRRLYYGPLAQPLSVARRGEILDDPAEIAGVLRGDDLRMFRDHEAFPCGHYVVRDGDRYSWIVTARRWEKGWFLPRPLVGLLGARRWPVTDVLHVSDPELAFRRWLPLRWRMMLRERTVGVTVQDSFVGPAAPAAASTPHRVHALRRRDADPRDLDGLYSEFVLLAPPEAA